MFAGKMFQNFVILLTTFATFKCIQSNTFFGSGPPILQQKGQLKTLNIVTKHISDVRSAGSEMIQADFEPYSNNGGTIAAIAGKGFAVLAADTRLAKGFSILSRNASRIYEVTDSIVMGSGGCWSDFAGLVKQLQYISEKYVWENFKPLSVQSFSTLLSMILYQRRLFPYYTFNVVAGIDENGLGAVYSYDAIGSYQRIPAACTGSAQHLLQPALDLLLKGAEETHLDVSVEEAIDILKQAFVAGSEREIHLGDSVEIVVIQEGGIRREQQILSQH